MNDFFYRTTHWPSLERGDNMAEYTDHSEDINEGLLFGDARPLAPGADAPLNSRGRSTSSIDVPLEVRKA